MDVTGPLSRRTFLAGAAATGAVLAADSLLPASGHAAGMEAPVEVVEWHSWSGDSKTYEENRVKQFNATHPGIHVTPLYVPDIPTKLVAAIAGGSPPDLVTADPTVLGYQGGLVDLTPYLKTLGWKPSDMLPGALPFMQYNGKIWAVCELGSLTFLYINKALFRQAGLDPNKPPTTIAQLDAYVEKLTTLDSSGNFKTIGFIPWAEDGSGYWGAWSDFLGPLIYLSDANKYTLSIGIEEIIGQDPHWTQLMAIGVVMTVPILVLFFFVQRTFIQGITFAGIKG